MDKKKALIVSLSKNLGHLSHVLAYQRLFDELGFVTTVLIDQSQNAYLPVNILYSNNIDDIDNVDVVLLYSTSEKNLRVINALSKKGSPLSFYVFHEPLTKLSSYRKAGFSLFKMFKLIVADYLDRALVRKVNYVLLPSKRSYEYYCSNRNYKNNNRYITSLIFDDESVKLKDIPKRSFFSYIGTIASDHSYQECIEFMLYAIENDLLPGISFLIATRNNVDRTPRVIAAQNTGRLRIVDGKPMTNDEINYWYASSYAIWNAYARTTQSGVLPKAFMFGTPAVVLRYNLSEFTEDRKEVFCIDDNTNKEQLVEAINCIMKDFQAYSDNCRNRFLNTYYYRTHNDEFRGLIEKA